jgi:hypothetical protein
MLGLEYWIVVEDECEAALAAVIPANAVPIATSAFLEI